MSCSALVGLLSLWSSFRLLRTIPARGRRAVEAELGRRGENLVSIAKLPRHALMATAGLQSLVVFQVVARARNGETRTYRWGYRPRGLLSRSEGLQRCAHGVWIALA
jgi:hypothetical protein